MKSYLDKLEYNPETWHAHHEHWCADCDSNVVRSSSKGTGRWFIATGHRWSAKGEWKGEYVPVLFALCAECLESYA